MTTSHARQTKKHGAKRGAKVENVKRVLSEDELAILIREQFAQSFIPQANRVWAVRRYWAGVRWLGVPLPPGTPVQVHHWNGQLSVLAADGTRVDTLRHALNARRAGLLLAQVAQDIGRLDLTYLGPDDFVDIVGVGLLLLHQRGNAWQ